MSFRRLFGFPAREKQSKAKGRLRGRGIATYIEMTAPGGFAPYDQAHITWEEDGGVTLRTASHSHGQSHETTFAQIVSGVLGIPMEKIRLRTAEPGFDLTANPTGGSRTLHGLGSAMFFASQEIVKDGMRLSAEALESAEADIEFVAGDYRIKGTDRSIGISALAKKFPGSWTWTSRTVPKSRERFPTAATSPRWRSIRRRARRRSFPTSPATTSATSSTTRSSKVRCRAA